MALVSRLKPQRIEIPHEPGEWLDLLPISAGAISALQKGAADKTPAGIMIELLGQCIKAWSYPESINIETISDLDSTTLIWLQTEVDVTSGIRPQPEKKDLSETSSPTTLPPQPVSNGSLVSSGI